MESAEIVAKRNGQVTLERREPAGCKCVERVAKLQPRPTHGEVTYRFSDVTYTAPT